MIQCKASLLSPQLRAFLYAFVLVVKFGHHYEHGQVIQH